MSFGPNCRGDDVVLPCWIGRAVAVIVLIVALGLFYYGIHDGMINQDIAYRSRSGKVGIAKGFLAFLLGVVFCGLGVGLGRLSALIFKSSRKNC